MPLVIYMHAKFEVSTFNRTAVLLKLKLVPQRYKSRQTS